MMRVTPCRREDCNTVSNSEGDPKWRRCVCASATGQRDGLSASVADAERRVIKAEGVSGWDGVFWSSVMASWGLGSVGVEEQLQV